MRPTHFDRFRVARTVVSAWILSILASLVVASSVLADGNVPPYPR